ncbi:MAG: permease [bacterium]
MPGSEQGQWKKAAGYLPFFAFLAFAGASMFVGWRPGIEVFYKFGEFASEIVIILPLVFMFIGLVDVWVPKDAIEKRLGEGAGLKGMFWVILLAMTYAGPLYAAFPVALMLRKKGCSVRNVFIYLGAFSAMKIPMLSFEIGFMGLKFSLLRLVFTLPVFIAIGVLMEKVLGSRYELREVASSAE